MTDLERFEQMWKDFGVETTREVANGDVTVTVPEGKGYAGFHLTATFGPDGKFEEYGVWE